MRKGTKRKAIKKDDEVTKSTEETNNKQPIKSTNKEPRKAKRTKTLKTESEPEFFPEKRNLVIVLFPLNFFIDLKSTMLDVCIVLVYCCNRVLNGNCFAQIYDVPFYPSPIL